jgi:DNA-directed RNA polymerase sigma subunit (sigma70/sigma32)
MPFEAKPIDPKAYEALDRIVAATEAMRTAEATRKEEAEKRARAIVDARRHGLSLDAIAERLGVSRERVRQMAVKTADPVRVGEEGPGPKANKLKRLR